MSDTGSRLLRNALYLFVGVIIANIGSFIFRILIAQKYGSSGFGLLSIGLMITSIATTISLLGLSDGMINFIPRNRTNENYGQLLGTIITGFSISLGIAIILTFSLVITSPIISNRVFGIEELTNILIWMSLIVPANILIRLSSAVALGFERGGYRVFIKQSFPRITLLVFTSIAIIIDLTITDIGRIYALSMWIAAVVGIGLLIKIIPTRKVKTLTANPQRLVSFSLPLMFASTAGLFLNWIDTAIVGIYLTESKVGIYQSAFLIANNIGIFLGAIAGSLYPNFSTLLENNSSDQIRERYTQGRRWGFLVSIAPITYLLFFPEQSLRFIFGSEFGQGDNSLQIILFGQFIYILTGPISNLLKSLERSRFIFMTYIVGGVSNLILNLSFVPRYGILGAAVGTSTATIIVHGSHYWKVNQEIKIGIFDFNLIRAGGAAVTAAMPSLVAALYVNSHFQFIMHILFFSILYIVGLYLLGGIDKQDLKQIYQAMI